MPSNAKPILEQLKVMHSTQNHNLESMRKKNYFMKHPYPKFIIISLFNF